MARPIAPSPTPASPKAAKAANAAKPANATKPASPARRAPAAGRTTARCPITPEDLRRFVQVGDPQISPDGSAILFTRKHLNDRNQEVSNLWLVDTHTGEALPFSNGAKDAHGRWSPDGTRIAFISGREKPKPQIYLLRQAGGESRPLSRLPEGSIGEFAWSPDARQIAFTFRETEAAFTDEARKKREEKGESTPPRVIDELWYRLDGDGYFNGQRHHLYILDVATGNHRLLFDKAPMGITAFAWSPDSSQLAISANLDPNPLLNPWLSRIFLLDVKSGRWHPIPKQLDGDRSNLAWSPDGRCLAFAGLMGRDILWGARNQRLYLIDPKNGRMIDLTGDHDFCLSAPVLSDAGEVSFAPSFRWHPDGHCLYAEIGHHGFRRLARIAVDGRPWEFRTPEDGQYALGNFTRDGRKAALIRSSSLELGEVFLGSLERKGITARPLTRFNAEFLPERVLSRPESHWVESADGTPVQLWIMRPPASPKGKRFPAILEIHGGPHAQYGEAFFHEFQVLAAQGFVVCFSNPRGSKGYGEAFCDTIKGDWGNRDWMDLQAVTAYLERLPGVDPTRLGVMGGSYGGYMTNWIIGHSERFSAAITDRCVSNLVSMAGSSDFVTPPDTYWKGNAWDEPEELWRQSPLRYLGRAKTPTLVIHSEGDLRCNVEQGEQVFAALKVLGVPTRFVRYPANTSHGMSRSGPADLRLHRLHQILDWMKKYLAPGKPGSQA